MTQANWVNMVRQGLAGTGVYTCFPAALDCLLENTDIPAAVYKIWQDKYIEQFNYGFDPGRSSIMYALVLYHAIGSSDENKINSKIVLSQNACGKIISEAKATKKYVILQVDESHDVGLKPADSSCWMMVGNQVPTRKILSTEEVFKYLYIPPISNILETQVNMFIIG